MKKIILFPLLATCISLFVSAQEVAKPNYEFRGVWVATVDNIDWPKKSNMM